MKRKANQPSEKLYVVRNEALGRYALSIYCKPKIRLVWINRAELFDKRLRMAARNRKGEQICQINGRLSDC